jgi:phycoerythrobilin:ferredoxin oxidoreductase
VLNFVIFPDPSLDAPIFGADLVQLPGGHLIVLDFQPVAATGGGGGGGVGAFDERLAALRARYAATLPDGGALPEAARPFFSPSYLFARLDATAEGTAGVRSTVRQAYTDYLALYLELVQDAARRGPIRDPTRAAEVRRGHVAYATYRAENDPARGMLTRMFGGEWTERLIYDVLFDWAERKGAGGGGGGGG